MVWTFYRTGQSLAPVGIRTLDIQPVPHSMKIDNSSIEKVEEFKYFGTTSTNIILPVVLYGCEIW